MTFVVAKNIFFIYSKLYVNNRITFIQVCLNAVSDLQYLSIGKGIAKKLQYLHLHNRITYTQPPG